MDSWDFMAMIREMRSDEVFMMLCVVMLYRCIVVVAVCSS